MKNGISSYLSIFDDWNLLKASLWSIADKVDEIVVVDGSYEWMTPAFEAMGRDPQRSRVEVYDTLSSFGKKVKVINGIWANESEKRQSGYAACTNRYILRHDSDEIVFWNEPELEDFFKSDYAVGQMQMPSYVSPGLIKATSAESEIERQSFIFDSQRISAFQHLSYLWLVLPPDEREKLSVVRREPVYQSPIAYTAHLTHWRSPETALNRARFYVLNYIRTKRELPWLPSFKYNNEKDFETLFQFVQSVDFDDILLGDPIVAAPPSINNMTIRPSPKSFVEEQSFSLLYDQMIASLARLNDDLAIRPRKSVNGGRYYLDTSVERSLLNLQRKGKVTLKYNHVLNRAEVHLSSLYSDGTVTETNIPVDRDDDRFSFSVPSLHEEYNEKLIRRTLCLTTASATRSRLLQFQAIK
jgi:hypothetical protein